MLIGSSLGKLLDRYIFRRIQPYLLNLRTEPEALAALRGRDLATELYAAANAPASGAVYTETERLDPDVDLVYRTITFPKLSFTARLYGEVCPDSPAVIFAHGWLQPSYLSLSETAALLSRRNLPVIIPELPYHLGRKPPGEAHGARFITGDLPLTLDNFLLALTELASVVAWLREVTEEIFTLGFSLGGLLTGLYACYAASPQQRAVLVAPAVRPAQVFLSSHLTDRVRSGILTQGLTPADIIHALSPMDLTRLNSRLAPGNMYLVAGRGDQAVPVALLRGLSDRWGCRYREVAAGHISLWLPMILGERFGVKRGLGWCRSVSDFLGG